MSHCAFDCLEQQWGPFTVDCFASDSNSRVSCFYSKLFSDKSIGMDAFAFSWDQEHCWLCPPVKLVVPAVKHLLSGSGSGVLCCPLWTVSSFWPLLCPDGVHLAEFIENHVIFSPKYFSAPTVTSKMFRGVPHWDTIAIFIGNHCTSFSSKIDRSHCIKDGCNKCC